MAPIPANRPPSTPPAPHGGLHLPRFALWIFGLVSVLPWLVLLYLVRDRPDMPPVSPVPARPAASSPDNPAAPESANVNSCKPGPWGELQFSRIVIEPPENLIDPNQLARRPTIWTFKGYKPADLTALWQSAALTGEQRQYIDQRIDWEQTADAIVMRPNADFVLGLSAVSRAKIYTALGEFAENPEHKDPFRFRADAASEWFRNSELAPETIALIERLLYRRGTSLLFSDSNLLLGKLPTILERARLIKALARKSTLLVKLRIRPDSDIEALDSYWGRGRRTKDLKPLLQSLTREPSGMTIDIIHLLPRLPRSLLYTYPAASEDGNGSFLDCHWTVLNFFNLKPDDRYQRIEAVTSAFLNDYFLVTGARTFGDILSFAQPDGAIIHTCVYIADDIVFTKNGSSPNAPWILMSLADVVAFYPSETPMEVQVYRAKEPGAPRPAGRE